jgi:hypothetical protein
MLTNPARDAAIVRLSVKAGLSCEIAGLEWSMVMTDDGEIGDIIDIRNPIAKRGSGRRIAMHPILQRARAELWRARTSDSHIVASNRGGAMRANSIVNWFVVMFAELELEGCSSHSGQRTADRATMDLSASAPAYRCRHLAMFACEDAVECKSTKPIKV